MVVCTDARFEQELLSFWLVFHVYVFNRLVFAILTKFNILAGSRYTMAILLGLAICVPPALGMSSLLLTVGAIVVFNSVFLCCMDASDVSGELYSCGGLSTAAKVKKHLVAPEGCCVAPSLNSSTRKRNIALRTSHALFSSTLM